MEGAQGTKLKLSLSQMAGSLSPSLSLALPISLHLSISISDGRISLSLSLNLSISISDSLPTVLSLRLPPFLVISFSSFSHALSYIFLPLSMFSFSSPSSPLSLYSLSFETGQRLGGLEFPCSQTRGLPAMSIHLMPDRHSLFLRVSSRQEKSNQGKLPAWLFYRPLLFNFFLSVPACRGTPGLNGDGRKDFKRTFSGNDIFNGDQ